MKKILITAFEPFGGIATNASYETVKRIQTDYKDTTIIKETLPVIYQPDLYEALLIRHQPDVVLLCGQAAGRKFVEIEHIAVNLMYALSADNKGMMKKGEVIFKDGDTAFFGTIPTLEITEQLKDLPVKLSLSAGGYVCNLAYYSTIYYNNKLKQNAKVGFIHFPLFEGQDNVQQAPTLPLDEMVSVLDHIINCVNRSI